MNDTFSCTRGYPKSFLKTFPLPVDLRASGTNSPFRASEVTFRTLLNMLYFLYIVLAFSPFIDAFPEVDLLLPGFHDETLQAGILSEVICFPLRKI